jgi:hypothetical protein
LIILKNVEWFGESKNTVKSEFGYMKRKITLEK